MIPGLYDIYKRWADTGGVYLISDPHLNDSESMLKNSNWPSADDYVNRINKIVHKSDTLVCLGDCGDLSYVKKLNAGHKVLIKGNHDTKGDSVYYDASFNEVYKGPVFISDKILLSHEPIFGLEFCVNIHGHLHGLIPKSLDAFGKSNVYNQYYDDLGGKHLCISSDIVGWEPVELNSLIKSGLVSDVKTIHRLSIDKRTIKKDRE